MPPSAFSLGTVSYVDQDKNIQLRVSGSTQISCTSHPFPQGDGSKLFEAVKSGKVWVSWQPSLLLHLTVKIHGHLHSQKNTESIFNDMAEILGAAQVKSTAFHRTERRVNGCPAMVRSPFGGCISDLRRCKSSNRRWAV